ncbi:MAG: ATP-binding protein [Phycisphaerales bacterium]|nr:ATP-binding protein [Phycisphaerales bacterium]
MNYSKKRFFVITVVYWILLLYIVIALVWWCIALLNQNDTILKLSLANVNVQNRVQNLQVIKNHYHHKIAQYVGEGIFFLLVLLVGATFVYQAIKKYFLLSDQQGNFMMAITHELHTPLTIAKLNIETLQKRGQLNQGQQQDMLEQSRLELDRLQTLCQSILVATTIENTKKITAPDVVALSDICFKQFSLFTIRFPKHTIEQQIEPNIILPGNNLYMELLITNLMSNAIKYAGEGSPIVLRLHTKGSFIILEVSDQGPGIPPLERNKIFDKFYRIGQEQTRKHSGTGIGLYIVKKIVQFHRGHISVGNNFPKGSVFQVTIPLRKI